MSRRFVFLLIATVVMLYFSLILFMLRPLHTVHGDPFSVRFPFRQVPVVDWCKPLRWRQPPQDVVGLISYPGSGNTWLRYLLQQATGIITGSVYIDHGLQLHGFPGESIINGSVLIVKSHEPVDYEPKFKAAVLLIRNPRDAILAEFNRQLKGHIGTAPKSAFRKRKNHRKVYTTNKKNATKHHSSDLLDWSYNFGWQLRSWEALHINWLTKFTGPIHVVFYELLVIDTRNILQGILNFLNFTISEVDMYCALAHKDGIYKRRNKLKNFDPFTPDMYKQLEDARGRVLTLLDEYQKRHNITDKVNEKII